MSTTEDTDDDIDSGWDAPDEEPAPSLAPASDESAVWDAAAEEIDAGWDIEPSEAPSAPIADAPQRRERQRSKPVVDQRRPAVVKPTPSRQPSAKKLERVMSRKHREREAQAKNKRELERKAQRKAEQAKRAAQAEELRAAEAKKREKRENRENRKQTAEAKPRTESAPKAKPAARRDVERRERSRREPADSVRKSTRKTTKAKAGTPDKRRKIVGGVAALVALGLLALLAWTLGR